MSAVRIRVRHPGGTATLSLPPTTTVADLRLEISTATGLPLFTLKAGFPPQRLDLDDYQGKMLLSETGLNLNGQQLYAEEMDVIADITQPLKTTAAQAAELRSDVAPAAKASSLNTQTSTARKPRTSENVAEDPPEIAVPTHNATMVLRVMPDDNSCLFRAVSAAALGTGGDDGAADSMHELRSLVASTIADQPDVYTAAILDKEPAQYCRWIQSDNSWGGAIELGILATHFGFEIASVNVQDGRVDSFNQGADRRIILVYSGIHYDVAALSPSEPPHNKADLPAELDERVYSSFDDVILQAARDLCSELRKAHYFTDTAGFGVTCNVAGCGWKGKGEREAVEHAKGTGHYDFGES